MYSSIRAKRVINAFINCVKTGVYSEDYAITLIEDEGKYGYLSDSDKEMFYESLETEEEAEEAAPDDGQGNC